MAQTARQLFEQSYDLPDPRTYFRLLAPVHYRWPAVISGFLKRHSEAIATARGKERLTLIDFACGFGAIGLLLKHEISLYDFYAYFESDPSDAGGIADVIAADRRFFATQRRADREDQLIGIDIARRALAYAEAVGALDEAHAVNLLAEAPPQALRQRLADADLVIESGALGDLLAPAMAKILDCGGRPWMLLSPRGDIDDAPLRQLLQSRGYRIEHCNRRPLAYRQFATPEERAEVLAAVTALGRDPGDWMDEVHFKINLWLARPAADCADLPIAPFILPEEPPS